MEIKKKKVIIAMSGGVDSSVSAYLLLQEGYFVEGVFMKNWEEDDHINYCSSSKDLYDVRQVCKKLGIYLHEINFSYEYWNDVFKVFISEYVKGNTPNPDVLCNKKIKFGILFNFVIKNLQFDYFATGHYAQIKYFNRQPFLIKGYDKNKDQSYFLYTLKSSKLKKILFPIGHLEKKVVRKIAQKINLHNAKKKDSVGICFIGPKNFSKFLNRFIPNKPGNILDKYGYIIGIHNGLSYYTIGQRKGMNLLGQYNKLNCPWYVIKKNFMKNSLIAAQGIKNKELISFGLIAANINWINRLCISTRFTCTVKIRYLQKEVLCQVQLLSLTSVRLFFCRPVFSVAIGQSVVFYNSEICLGGGIIQQSFHDIV